MIQFNKVSKRYLDREALSQISFKIPDNQLVFITGHSGAGKSTLLKLIALLEQPSNGTILINNRNLSMIKRSEIPRWRRSVGVVFQGHHLLPNLTVAENVLLPLHVSGFYHREAQRRVKWVLESLELGRYLNSLPSRLSAGEQQRVSIARAMVKRPAILLADEPTGNLDEKLSKTIFSLFERFLGIPGVQGMTILVATHDQKLLEENRQYPVIELSKGKLISSTLERGI